MHVLEKFRYCPVCGSKHFEPQDEKSKKCENCGFEYYLNPSASVAAFILNDEGELLTVRRKHSPGKGMLDLPGGFADIGETIHEALVREVKEETGLDASEAEGGYLFTYKRENPGEGDNYFVDVYRFVMDVEDKDLKLQTEETDGYMFATLEQIRAFAAEGKFLHYDSIKKVFEF